VLVAAAWLFWRSHADLGRNWSVHVRVREDHTLVTSGVYSWIRHPMYAALLLAAAGLIPVLHNWVVAAAMLSVAFLFAVVRAPHEERFLISHFGERYRTYISRSGRLFPRFMAGFGFWLSRAVASTKASKRTWPYVPGKYIVVDPRAPVAVTTLGSIALAQAVAQSRPQGLCIVGKVETENIGIEKIVKNIIANPAIQFLLCAGQEPPKHLSGATLVALFENGVDSSRRILGSPGVRPVLPNTTIEEVAAFRRQVRVIDMIGCTDVQRIATKVRELAILAPDRVAALPNEPSQETPRIPASAPAPDRIKLDKAGYFVIDIEDRRIVLEHYDYKERLLRLIEGDDARSLYWTLIANSWVTKLDHAAYLGKELARAELSLKTGLDFEQDGA
jgi:tetrahydromethanopterin S-methyltransferase subunit A